MKTKARPRFKLTAPAALQLGWSVEHAGHWWIRRTAWPVATHCGVTFNHEAEALAEVEARIASDLHITVRELRKHLGRLLP